MRRVGVGSDDDEIVPRDLPPVDAVALVDEFLLGLGVVDEDEIGVAAPRRVERLAGALRQHMHRDAGRLGEVRQDRARAARNCRPRWSRPAGSSVPAERGLRRTGQTEAAAAASQTASTSRVTDTPPA